MTETGNPPAPEPVEPPNEVRLIRSLKLTNFLSFGPAGEEIELRGLNVLVGANGSGKSNFVEVLAVIASSTTDLTKAFRIGGGVRLFFNNLKQNSILKIQTLLVGRDPHKEIAHSLYIAEEAQRLKILAESIQANTGRGRKPFKSVYSFDGAEVPVVKTNQKDLFFRFPSDERQSVLSQVKDLKVDSEIGSIQKVYESIRLYRDWTFGLQSAIRKPQAADLPNDWLAEDYGNLFLILNRLEFEPDAKAEYLDRLRDFLPDVTDYKLQIIGGTIQMFLMEGRTPVPATRLSDGTLRWLCLLAILVAPAPPSVVVLEEPELGLHPDMINTLADMLKKASQRMQLIVTTHSDILIDALSDVPEAVMVVEKGANGTTVRRLNAEQLQPWLEEYRLGRLWMQGQIGGTRW